MVSPAPPPPQAAYNEDHMREALRIAEHAYEVGEVPVGCVLVHDGQIIARGRNRPNESLNVSFALNFWEISDVTFCEIV